MTQSFMLAGALVGLTVSVPIGPMGVLCIRRTLTDGFAAGIATGMGATTAQMLFATVLVAAMQQAGPWLDGNRSGLGLAGATIMLLFAWRVLRPRRLATVRPAASSVLLAYATAFGLNLLNPMSVALLAGAIAAIVGTVPSVGDGGTPLLLGLAAGSLSWWLLLSIAVSASRSMFSAGVLMRVNQLSAAVMVGFGVLALVRAAAG